MRKLACRYVMACDLLVETPLHVGGASSDVRSDMPLAEDGRGRIYLPGTSLAGPMRAWSVSEWGEDTYPWGPPPRERGDRVAVVISEADRWLALVSDALGALGKGAGVRLAEEAGYRRGSSEKDRCRPAASQAKGLADEVVTIESGLVTSLVRTASPISSAPRG